MKILFLHLSDMHFEEKKNYRNYNVEQIVNALYTQSIGEVEAVGLIMTGDLAFSGRSEEYEAVYRFIGKLRRLIMISLNINPSRFFVCTVPGNHDKDYNLNSASSRKGYEQVVKWDADKDQQDRVLELEFASQEAFFEFSKQERCDFGRKNRFFSRKIVEISGFKIEINMLNTAPMSLKEQDDRGLHYISSQALKEFEAPSGADFVVTLMHHSHQNFCDIMRAELERVLFSKNSIVFSGHDHNNTTQRISYNDQAATMIICGGALSNRGSWADSEFFACVLDTDTYACFRYRFKLEKDMYLVTPLEALTLPSKPSYGIPGTFQEAYEEKLFSDTQYGISQSVLDYFVFPRIRRETTDEDSLTREISTFEEFLKELETKKRIAILGESGSGKTTLLKKLFDYYYKKKVVLFCSIDEIVTGNRNRILKAIFEETYGSNPVDYQRYCQLPSSQKMLLVDDINLIKPSHLTKFMEGIEKEFDYVIYTSDNSVQLAIEDRIKASIGKDLYTQYELIRFYSDKRQELVEKVVNIKMNNSPKADDMGELIISSLKKQRRYLSLTPSTILQYINYYLQNRATGVQTDGNIFGKVFEASITTAVQKNLVPPLSVEKIYMILDKIAYYIHAQKKYPVSHEEILNAIKQYNDEYGDSVDFQDVLNICINAKILRHCSDANQYKFFNNNYLAYFAAREIRRLCIDKNYDPLKEVLNYACFGINASILMFITYLTDDLSLLKQILAKAIESVKDWDEFKFETLEISYLKSARDFSISAPSKKEIEEDKERELTKDRVESDSNLIDTKNIYDYSEDDLAKLTNKLSRSLSLLIVIARCFPNFEHLMKKADKECFVREIYQIPNQIFDAWAKDVDIHKEELIRFITEFQTNEFGRQNYTETDALCVLQWESMSLLLELYYTAVANAYRPNSFDHLTNVAYINYDSSDAYKVERALIYEFAGKTDDFITACEELYKKGTVGIKNTLVKRMVRHLMMTSKKVSYTQIHHMNSVFFNEKKNTDVLLLRSTNITE